MSLETPAFNLPAKDLEESLAVILRASGCALDIASEVAAALVDSDQCGHGRHGSRQIDFYVERLRRGDVDGMARPAIVSETANLLRVAGNRAFGQIAGAYAARVGAACAARHGVSIVCLSNSGHLGRNGRWPEIAADMGIGSLHFGQGIAAPGQVAPHGGREGRLNTNPVALGLPGSGHADSIILDFATSSVSGSAIKQAHDRGAPLEGPFLVAQDGSFTNDPAAFIAGEAAATTFGGFKGFGISIFSEIVSTILAPAGDAQPATNSLFSVYFALDRLIDIGRYRDLVSAYRDRVVGCPPMPGVEAVVMPGDRARRTRERTEQLGVQVTSDMSHHIRRAAKRVGVLDRVVARVPGIAIANTGAANSEPEAFR